MSNIDDLGFKSTLTLMKIGHELRGTLDETVEAPIPKKLQDKVVNIFDNNSLEGEIIVEPCDYQEVSDGTTATR